jgi:hypothetical protein
MRFIIKRSQDTDFFTKTVGALYAGLLVPF